MNVIIFSALFIGDGVADPVGRLTTAWAASLLCAPSTPAGQAKPPPPAATAQASGTLRARGSTAAATATASVAGAGAVGCGGATPAEGKTGKPLLPLQYRVGHFGVKSYPGSLAFFCASLCAAAGWAALFDAAGHYGPDFSYAAFLAAATACVGVATVAEAISPPHVDNLLVSYAAAATGYCLSESGLAPFLMRTCV